MKVASACPSGSVQTGEVNCVATEASESFPKLCVETHGDVVHGVL